MFDIDWVGLSVPFAYIAVLVGSLITFSSVYRKRKAGKESIVGISVFAANLYSQICDSRALVPTTSTTEYLPFTVT